MINNNPEMIARLLCHAQETETKKKVAKAPKAKAEPKPKPEPKKRKPAPAKKEDKKKKAKKDPNAPKKALSAFMFFSSAKRDEVCPYPAALYMLGNLGPLIFRWWVCAEVCLSGLFQTSQTSMF